MSEFGVSSESALAAVDMALADVIVEQRSWHD